MSQASGDIEVGANAEDGTLRFWVAQEAIRQGEIRLASQMAIMTVVTGRASAILGWSVTILLALAAALVSLNVPTSPAAGPDLVRAHFALPVLAAALCMLSCAVCCIRVLWPGRWYAAGHNPLWLIGQPYPTELEVKEAIAEGYAGSIVLNAQALRTVDLWLQGAWLLFIGSPVSAIAVYVARQYLPSQPG